MDKYSYTQSWFLNSEIHKNLLKYVDKNKQNNILEIGCYEGLSSCFFSDTIMDHEYSSMDCVDPFFTSGSVKEITSQNVSNITEENFINNQKKSKNYKKITFYKQTSDDFFNQNTSRMYNFIYIDGCHEPDFIKRDMENSFKRLAKGGILWMDDYGGGNHPNYCKIPMDNFLKEHEGEYSLIHKSYQLAIKKII